MEIKKASEQVFRCTTRIIVAYLSSNRLPAKDLPSLIMQIQENFWSLMPEVRSEERRPVVPVQHSIQQDTISCLECGRRVKTLRRHLREHHNLTVEAYKKQWKLGRDYPLVPPQYSALRSAIAKKVTKSSEVP